MTNKILFARRTSPLVRVWHSTTDPRMPLIATWVHADTVKPANPSDSSSDETWGLCLCA